MADKRKQNPKFRLRGAFVFPRLGEPDTKFNPAGAYTVRVRVDEETADKLLAQLNPLHAEAASDGKEKYAALPVASRRKLEAKGAGFVLNGLRTPVYDDEENETGEWDFNFKMVASGVYAKGPKTGQKWTRKPAVFDAKGKPMDGSKVWGGSEGVVVFEARPYFVSGTGAAGLSLQLEAVQVIDLVTGGQRTAKGYGFEEEEGYEDEDAPASPSKESTDTQEDASEDEDF